MLVAYIPWYLLDVKLAFGCRFCNFLLPLCKLTLLKLKLKI